MNNISKNEGINQYDEYGKFIKKYKSVKEASFESNCHTSGIYKCCKGIMSHIKGFQWRYANDDKSIVSQINSSELHRLKKKNGEIEIACCICGSDKWVQQLGNTNDYYCTKHYGQMKKYGKIVRTIRDGNEVIKYEKYSEIILTDIHLNEVGRVKISSDKLEMTKGYRWYLTSVGYACSKSKGSAVLLHRLITNAKAGEVVDHINRDRLDCTNSNLRICTQSENTMNSSLSKRNTSGTTGVWFNKSRNKWVAEIFENGKKHSLGNYIDKVDAIRARKEAENKYFGEFAPERGEQLV